MSATLIIPDVHLDFARAENWIVRLAGRHTQVVFLGDYFDSHNLEDTPERAAETAEWLRSSLCRSERVHLVGNHDLSYLFPGSFTACSGFTEEKHAAVQPVFRDHPFKRLRPAVEQDGWLLTHAGINRQLVKGLPPSQILGAIESQWDDLKIGGLPPLFACGYARGGGSVFGGITWQDFGEFQPIPGLNQIFAHTPADTVRVHWMLPGRHHVLKRAHRLNRIPGEVVTRSQSSCVNVCLDTELQSVALIDNGALTIFAEDLPRHEQLIVRC